MGIDKCRRLVCCGARLTKTDAVLTAAREVAKASHTQNADPERMYAAWDALDAALADLEESAQ